MELTLNKPLYTYGDASDLKPGGVKLSAEDLLTLKKKIRAALEIPDFFNGRVALGELPPSGASWCRNSLLRHFILQSWDLDFSQVQTLLVACRKCVVVRKPTNDPSW